MKILHTSDFHIGLNIDSKEFGKGETNRIYEIQNVLNEIVTYCKDVEVLSIAGDIFHFSFPSPFLVTIFQNFLLKVKAINENIKIFIIPGNHDWSSVSYKHSLLSIEKCHYNNVFIFDKLDNIVLNNINFIFLPFMGRYFNIENINQEISKMIMPNNKNILVGHFSYMDVPAGSESVLLRESWSLKQPINGIDIMLLGHIHTNFCGESYNKFYYAGSPIEIDVGERGFDKKIMIIDTDDLKKNQTISLKQNLHYKLVEFLNLPTEEDMKQLNITDKDIVVLRFKIKRDEKININLIQKYLNKANFFRIETEYINEIQARNKDITEKIDPMLALIMSIETDDNAQVKEYKTDIVAKAKEIFSQLTIQ